MKRAYFPAHSHTSPSHLNIKNHKADLAGLQLNINKIFSQGSEERVRKKKKFRLVKGNIKVKGPSESFSGRKKKVKELKNRDTKNLPD